MSTRTGQNVGYLTYLDNILTSNCSIDINIKSKINLPSTDFDCLKETILSNYYYQIIAIRASKEPSSTTLLRDVDSVQMIN